MERIHDHPSTRTTFLNVDDTKAGMGEVDKEKINRLIQEASKSIREPLHHHRWSPDCLSCSR